MKTIDSRSSHRSSTTCFLHRLSVASLTALAALGVSACGSDAPDETIGDIGTAAEAITCSKACSNSTPCGTVCTGGGSPSSQTSCGNAGLACTVGTKCTEAACEAWGGDALAVCGKAATSCSTVNPEQGVLCNDCDATSAADAGCYQPGPGGWVESTCGETGVYQGMCSVVCDDSVPCNTPCGAGGLDNATCAERYSVNACDNDPSASFCADGGTCAEYLAEHNACSDVCTWSSSHVDKCFDHELQEMTKCERYGVSRSTSDCLSDPSHPGCPSLKRGMGSNGQPSQSYGTCNDGTTVPVVAAADSSSWAQLGGPRDSAGSEQNRIDTLMNNAALSIGCNVSPSSQPTTDGGGNDASFVKGYVGSSGKPNSCGIVYFNKKLGCAFATSTTESPPAGAAYRTSFKLQQLYASLGAQSSQLGLPTSNPISDQAVTPTVSWQRFTRGYITYRSPDASAQFVGGTAHVADRAVASAYGRLFDHGQAINYWPLAQAMECAHPDAGKCAPGNTGRYAVTHGAVNAGPESGFPAVLVAKTAGDRGFIVRGPLAVKWLGTPSARPWQPAGPGFPLADRRFVSDISRYSQPFERGRGFESNSDPTKTWIVGPGASEAMAGYGDALGAPIGARVALPGGGFSQLFEGGGLFEKPTGEVFAVEGGAHGPLAPYLAAGGPSGKWGWPLEGTPDFGNTALQIRKQRFQFGSFDLDTIGVWEWAPQNVFMPGYLGAQSHAPYTVHVGWYATGVNASTKVYRISHDAAGMPLPAKLVKTVPNQPTGSQSFVDSAATSADGSAPAPDTKHCYRLVVGDASCTLTSGGSGCLTTPMNDMCAWGRAATPHSVGRVQLRLRVSSASSAEAVGAHIQVNLQSPYLPYGPLPTPRGNNTWIDSTKVDFASGSNITYDLNTGNIRDLSDITQITVRNVDGNRLCINEVELLVDNTRAFQKSFGANGAACQGSVESDESTATNEDSETFSISHAELRASPDWIAFSPPNLVHPDALPLVGPRTFGGLRKAEFISVLDAAFADRLRNPANGHGPGAGFLDGQHTTSTRINSRRLHFRQNVLAQNDGWWDGDTTAHPEFDLVIHNDDPDVCDGFYGNGQAKSCLKVENVDAHASYFGWNVIILGTLGGGLPGAVGAQLYADHVANTMVEGSLADTLVDLSEVDSAANYCFPSADFPTDIANFIFRGQGFENGGLTVCLGAVTGN